MCVLLLLVMLVANQVNQLNRQSMVSHFEVCLSTVWQHKTGEAESQTILRTLHITHSLA